MEDEIYENRCHSSRCLPANGKLHFAHECSVGSKGSHFPARSGLGIAAGEDKDLIVQSLDSDHSGKIEYSEFVAGCVNVSNENIRAQIPIAFSIFDLDNSGAIGID